jgi:hypothetical protein
MNTDKTVRIGGASGFWGDSLLGAPQLAESGQVDYLVFDYLAETTMAILAAARRKRPELGYATDFVDVVMPAVLPTLMQRGIKVVSNAGGIHPQGCAEALRAIAASMGLAPRIAVVVGDDVTEQLPRLREQGVRDMFSGEPLPAQIVSANAYLGAFPVAQALAAGADIVITGRAVDSTATLGILVHEFGWRPDQLDQLASGSLAGHIIEYGCQATGGLHTDWEGVPDWPHIGYPIVECRADGSFDVTKPAGTGGLIARAAVAEQLLYEIGDPGAYVLPDVVCDFRHVRIEQVDGERVRVRGARGRTPTATYKVSATWMDGWRCAGSMAIVGIDAAAKARRTGEAIIARTRRILQRLGLPDYTSAKIALFGAETLYGPHARTGASREVMVRVSVTHPVKQALEIFAREIAPAGTSWAPGTTNPVGSGRPGISPHIRPLAFLVDKALVPVQVIVDGQATPAPLRVQLQRAGARTDAAPAAPPHRAPTVGDGGHAAPAHARAARAAAEPAVGAPAVSASAAQAWLTQRARTSARACGCSMGSRCSAPSITSRPAPGMCRTQACNAAGGKSASWAAPMTRTGWRPSSRCSRSGRARAARTCAA